MEFEEHPTYLLALPATNFIVHPALFCLWLRLTRFAETVNVNVYDKQSMQALKFITRKITQVGSREWEENRDVEEKRKTRWATNGARSSGHITNRNQGEWVKIYIGNGKDLKSSIVEKAEIKTRTIDSNVSAF